MSNMDVSNLTKNKLEQMFLEGKRFDSRSLLEFRDLKIETNVSNKAEGSARVILGKTEVVVGVKLEIGDPYPDSLDKGNLMVSGDLLPLASPRFESGPPGFDAIELPRLIDRAIRGAEVIELKKLVLESGKVWTVIIDIYPINDDGNLIDASTIGALVALKEARIPAVDENGRADYSNRTDDKLPLNKNILPLSFSFFKLGTSLILDPSREEEEASESRITFSASLLEGKCVVNSCQKKDKTPFSAEEISKIMDLLPEKYNSLLEQVRRAYRNL